MIVFGYKLSQSAREEIIQVCREQGLAVHYKEARPDDSGKVIIEDLPIDSLVNDTGMDQLDTKSADSSLRHSFIEIDYVTQSVRGGLHFYTFINGGLAINNVPYLPLSSQGKTLEEADEMMLNSIIPTFFDYIVSQSKPAIIKYFQRFGWSAANDGTRFEITAPVNTANVLVNFDLPEGTPIGEDMMEIDLIRR